MNTKEEFHKAKACLDKEDTAGAIELLTKVVNHYEGEELNEDESYFDSLHQVALHQLGNIYLIKGEHSAALTHFDKYIQYFEETFKDNATPEQINLYHIFVGSKGKSLFDLEKFEDAQKEFIKIIEYYHKTEGPFDHISVVSLYYYALCFFRLEQYPPALHFLDTLINHYEENGVQSDEIYYESVFCKVSILLKVNDVDNSLAQLTNSIDFYAQYKMPNDDILEEFKSFKQHIIDSVNKQHKS